MICKIGYLERTLTIDSTVLKELRPPMIPIRDLKRESRTITESTVMVEEYWRVRGRGLKFPNLTHPLRASLRI
ncbi:uncharacterized protein RSE6_06094 [Rhynchosporium secalis]|uniref:Uncharacterized protein n=1 Tax=Rhynchosporium secalis TaxID=38038 RepID=A0A1E1M9L7_RHYSE|nr:uncharacterized protein RSE6_06094 [Rhynchosporium secalis]